MLNYTAHDSGGNDSSADLERSKESRRSWTSKHKPYTCRHPGCQKSYFFVHDVRRHLRQKHNGMDYNEESGEFVASVGDDSASQMVLGGGDQKSFSPLTGHDGDDRSRDTHDNAQLTTANGGMVT